MITKEEKELLQTAINEYGCCLQQDVAIEEMSELTKAIIKFRRSFVGFNQQRISPELKEVLRSDIAEEVADVLIMMEQLKLIYDIEEDVEKWKEKKLNRLKERLNS